MVCQYQSDVRVRLLLDAVEPVAAAFAGARGGRVVRSAASLCVRVPSEGGLGTIVAWPSGGAGGLKLEVSAVRRNGQESRREVVWAGPGGAVDAESLRQVLEGVSTRRVRPRRTRGGGH